MDGQGSPNKQELQIATCKLPKKPRAGFRGLQVFILLHFAFCHTAIPTLPPT
jgi:hypothetical protein